MSLQAQTRLNVGTDDFPPYEFYKGGKEGNPVTGFSTEVILIIFNQMNIDPGKIKIFPWKRAEHMVFEGELDMLYSATKGELKLSKCYFPEEALINSKWVLFIRKDNKDRHKFDHFDDLIGKAVGTVMGYTYTPELWTFLKEKGKYNEVAKEEHLFKMLQHNRLDYAVSELGVGLSIVKDLGIQDQIMPLSHNPIKEVGFYTMFSKRTVSKELVDEFSKRLKAFKLTSEYKRIRDKYF